MYGEIAGGRIARPAAERVAAAPSVIAAVQSGRPAAVRAAIAPLLRGQLARVRVSVGGRTLAEYGTANGVAPVTVPLRDAAGTTIGTLTASEQGAYGYSDTVHGITGAQVFVRVGSRRLEGSESPSPGALPDHGEVSYRGTRWSVYAFRGIGFPHAPMRVFVLAPVPLARACAATPEETAAAALAGTAMRVYREEQSSPATQEVVRAFEDSRAFQQAVAGDNPAATRAAIVAFFETTLHVVRVRALLGEHLVADVGGPHVLAPARGAVRDSHGRLVGHFLLSVQDDLGYVILVHRFTGAQVFLRQGSEQVSGNVSPGPTAVPTHGPVTFRGVRYLAAAFTVEAFPSGPLRVELLIPPVRGVT